MKYNRASSPHLAGATGGLLFLENLPSFIVKGVCDMAKLFLKYLLERKLKVTPIELLIFVSKNID